ncbi:conserved hypothetical protein [delta proteobacterium NaphS2]|nr:conserved hypothetical protein [delta proteobacterium NaphS2]
MRRPIFTYSYIVTTSTIIFKLKNTFLYLKINGKNPHFRPAIFAVHKIY